MGWLINQKKAILLKRKMASKKTFKAVTNESLHHKQQPQLPLLPLTW